MSKRFWFTVFAVLVAASMVLTACQAATPAPTQAPETEAAATEAPTEAATEAPTEAPTPTPTPIPAPKGAWVDEVVVSTFDSDQAVPRLKAGDVDIYADTLVDADTFNEVKSDPNLDAAVAVTGKSVDIQSTSTRPNSPKASTPSPTPNCAKPCTTCSTASTWPRKSTVAWLTPSTLRCR